MSGGFAVTEEAVLAALKSVVDPEIDRDIVDLEFVSSVETRGREVRVELRLPTYWCAPNFSWLMASDARAVLLRLPGVDRVLVVLADHHAGVAITRGVNEGARFEEVFSEDASEGVEPLRRLFRRKAYVARLARVLRSLPATTSPRLPVRDLPDTEEAQAYLRSRTELGLDCSPDAAAITDAEGRLIADVQGFLRQARVLGIAMEGNAALCRSLLQARYAKDPAKT
jgi:metal-sulfur cluster biosynthetic enzyme